MAGRQLQLYTLLSICVALQLCITGCFSSSVRYSRNTGSSTAARDSGQSAIESGRRAQLPSGKLTQVVQSYLGTPYRWGGSSRRGFDCSGFVSFVFREVYQRVLPRSTGKLREVSRPVPVSQARPGDLVFFRGGALNRINHVGIYMGADSFAHASSSQGVVYSRLSEDYYKRRFVDARRVY